MSALVERQHYDVEQDVSDSVRLRHYIVPQVAQIFGRCTATVCRAVQAGKIPSRRVAGSLLIPRQWVDAKAWMEVNA